MEEVVGSNPVAPTSLVFSRLQGLSNCYLDSSIFLCLKYPLIFFQDLSPAILLRFSSCPMRQIRCYRDNICPLWLYHRHVPWPVKASSSVCRSCACFSRSNAVQNVALCRPLCRLRTAMILLFRTAGEHQKTCKRVVNLLWYRQEENHRKRLPLPKELG